MLAETEGMSNALASSSQFVLYTDASVAGPATWGGVAGVLVEEGEGRVVREGAAGIDFHSTCTMHAELSALLFSLRLCEPGSDVLVRMDNVNVVWLLFRSGTTGAWEPERVERMMGIRSRKQEARLAQACAREQALLDEIRSLQERLGISLRAGWVKGHGCDAFNSRADRLADKARRARAQ